LPIAHVLDLGFIQMGPLVLLVLRAEMQFVDMIDDLAQVVAALDLVFDLAEDFGDFILDGVRPGRFELEPLQVREEFLVDEVAKIVAGQRGVVVELAVLALGRSPAFPSVGLIEEVGVLLVVKVGLGQPILLEIIEIFEEEQPRGLLGIVELGGASSLLAEDIIDIAKSLFEQTNPPKRVPKPAFAKLRTNQVSMSETDSHAKYHYWEIDASVGAQPREGGIGVRDAVAVAIARGRRLLIEANRRRTIVHRLIGAREVDRSPGTAGTRSERILIVAERLGHVAGRVGVARAAGGGRLDGLVA
jgi:hypothetical protein